MSSDSGEREQLGECPICKSNNVRWGNCDGETKAINVCFCKRCQIEFVFCWHGNREKYARAFNDRK